MTENNEQNASQFKEKFGGFFHDLFKIVGMAIPPYAHERFRHVGEQVVALIEQVAKYKAIQVITTLQKAVSSGFDKTESEMNNLQTLTLSHTTLIGELISGQKHTAKTIEELESRIKELESQVSKRWGVIRGKEIQPPSRKIEG